MFGFSQVGKNRNSSSRQGTRGFCPGRELDNGAQNGARKRKPQEAAGCKFYSSDNFGLSHPQTTAAEFLLHRRGDSSGDRSFQRIGRSYDQRSQTSRQPPRSLSIGGEAPIVLHAARPSIANPGSSARFSEGCGLAG